MSERFQKAVLEFEAGKYIYSCDVCGRVAYEVFPIIFGLHGEKIDLCAECLDSDKWGERY
jgi:hypothetical protein